MFNTTKQEQFHWREVDDEEDEWKWCSMQKIVNQPNNFHNTRVKSKI